MRTTCLLVAIVGILACTLVSGHPDPNVLATIPIEDFTVAEKQSGAIATTPSVLSGYDTDVTVHWNGITGASGSGDYISVWSPKPKDFTKVAPVKVKKVSSSGGSGSTQLNLINMRESYTIAYLNSKHQILSVSSPVEFDSNDYNLPLQIHLAYTNTDDEIRVMWNSKEYGSPVVSYGLTANDLANVSEAKTSTFNRTDMCGSHAKGSGWHAPGWLHSAILTGLIPNTQYFYQISDATLPGSSSAVESFYSRPVASATTDVDFVVFGDLGQVETDGSNEHTQMPGSLPTTKAITADIKEGIIDATKSPAIFHIGDISYARGFETMWEQFFAQIRTVARSVPWHTSIGNHERDFPNSGSLYTGKDSGGECGVPYEHRFLMPTQGRDKPWWSMSFGPVHIIMLSTEHEWNATSEQHAWLKADLQSVDRLNTPFLIVTGHRPMYVAAHAGPNPEHMRSALEDLMINYRVDVAFWGHTHTQQRTCILNNYICVSNPDEGITHIVAGAAGAGMSGDVLKNPPKWIEYIETTEHGYMRAFVRGDNLKLDFVASKSRKVLDSVTIPSKFPHTKKPKHPKQPKQHHKKH